MVLHTIYFEIHLSIQIIFNIQLDVMIDEEIHKATYIVT